MAGPCVGGAKRFGPSQQTSFQIGSKAWVELHVGSEMQQFCSQRRLFCS
jgi:hypothetical protein